MTLRALALCVCVCVCVCVCRRECVAELKGHDHVVECLLWGGGGGRRECVAELKGHDHVVECLAFCR